MDARITRPSRHSCKIANFRDSVVIRMSAIGSKADWPLFGSAFMRIMSASGWKSVIALLSRRCEFSRMKQREERFEVEVTGADEIVCRAPGQAEQSIRMEDVAAVYVETNDSGPSRADVWWLLEDNSGVAKVAFPQMATGQDTALNRLRLLPGFEVRGMNSTDDARFMCWPNPDR